MKTNFTFESSQQNTKPMRFWFIILVVMTLVLFGASIPAVLAEEDDLETPFDEAVIYFELNNTDGDLGIHALIDGQPWKRLEIEDPNERRMLAVNVRGRLRRQGLTEIFFESAEPAFEELAPEKFFNRFPEGEYEIEGRTLEGDELESEVWLSHVMPAPTVVFVNGESAAEDCDADELPEVEVGETVIISWEPVTEHHPDLGGSGDIEVQNYEVVVEIDDTPWKTSSILSPDVTTFQVPAEILSLAEYEEGEAEIKFEVLVRATNANQTAVESCFKIVEEYEEN